VKTVEDRGYVDVLGYKLYYRTFGIPKNGTILCLHGGPGATHDYMIPMVDLTKFGYLVVFYDMLGCGKSEMPKNHALFLVERYVEEIEGLRKALHLGPIHLLGSSCGGQFGIAYALKYQKNLKSLITVGGIHNWPLAITEMEKMKKKLPRRVYEKMLKYEHLGEYQNPAYLKAVDFFYRKHLNRMKRWPDGQVYTSNHMSHPVYYTMNGPNEFTVLGNIRYWDVTNQLHMINVPTLILTGRYDEISPKVGKDMHQHIKGSKFVVFPKSSHSPFWEQRREFMTTVNDFLAQAD
jgi:proline iminopeptidase